MKAAERDLLIVRTASHSSETGLEKEFRWLNDLLNVVEANSYIKQSIELIDVHHHRIRSNTPLIDRLLRNQKLEPFQFLFQKN